MELSLAMPGKKTGKGKEQLKISQNNDKTTQRTEKYT
jgi:hypothetical protein